MPWYRKISHQPDFCSVGNIGPFFEHDDAIADDVGIGFHIFEQVATFNHYIVADAAVFVNNGVFDVAVFAKVLLTPKSNGPIDDWPASIILTRAAIQRASRR